LYSLPFPHSDETPSSASQRENTDSVRLFL
jgi:hypothetical protein